MVYDYGLRCQDTFQAPCCANTVHRRHTEHNLAQAGRRAAPSASQRLRQGRTFVHGYFFAAYISPSLFLIACTIHINLIPSCPSTMLSLLTVDLTVLFIWLVYHKSH